MKIRIKPDLRKYPGGEIVEKGLKDLSRGIFKSIEALALLIASPRLNELGFKIQENKFKHPNLMLYKKLGAKYGNEAHFQYNAIMARVNKFCNSF